MFALFKDDTQISVSYKSKWELMDAIHLRHKESYFFHKIGGMQTFRKGYKIKESK